MANNGRRYSPELRESAVRQADIARENGVSLRTLQRWMRIWRSENGGTAASAPLRLSARGRLNEAERENRELRMEIEFLVRAVAFFVKKSQ